MKKEFDPDDYPDIFFANWFDKDHFEEFLNEKITKEQFEDLKIRLEESGLYDEVSKLMREYLNNF